MEDNKEGILSGYPNVISYECTKKILNKWIKIYVKLRWGNYKELDSFVKFNF